MAPAALLIFTQTNFPFKMNAFKTVQSENNTIEGIEAGFRYENYMQYEQGPEASEIQFFLKCMNLPLGTVIGFYCPEPGPDPMISLPPTVVTAGPGFVAGMMSYVPANFSGKIYYYAEFRVTPPANASLQLYAAYPVQP